MWQAHRSAVRSPARDGLLVRLRSRSTKNEPPKLNGRREEGASSPRCGTRPYQDERNQQMRGRRARPYHALAEAPLQRGERGQVRLREPSASVCTHARTKPPTPSRVSRISRSAPHHTQPEHEKGRAGITWGEAGEVDEDGGDPCWGGYPKNSDNYPNTSGVLNTFKYTVRAQRDSDALCK
jgi:hypothetical protein